MQLLVHPGIVYAITAKVVIAMEYSSLSLENDYSHSNREN